VALDQLSIAEYLDRLGVSGWLRRLIDVAYLTEYGLETGEQSSLNLLTLIGTDTNADFAVFGNSDQRYKLLGGNEQIPQALARELGPGIKTEHRLVRVRHNAHGVQLSFDTAGVAHDVKADAIVLALPFTLLRGIDLGDTLPPAKMQAIRELGYGRNAKFLIGTHRRVWREQGFGGDLYTDLPIQTGWDGSRLRAGERGVYTFFVGGDAGTALGQGTANEHAGPFAAHLDSVFPGVAAQRTGSVARVHWPSEPYALGSYSCYRPGQWTTLAGLQQSRVGPIFFAGEHCSAEFQGYMNGAAQTGREAAAALLASF
jgi:monoamine oxidase